jgi:tetratricopeptide (TPR) repeat protein
MRDIGAFYSGFERRLRSLATFLVVLALSFFFAVSVSPRSVLAGTDEQAKVVAAPYSIEGSVSVRRKGANDWSEVRAGTTFRVGDTVRTGEDGAVAFKFVDGTLVRLGRTSAITFSDVTPRGAPVVSQTEGKSYFFSRGAKNEPEIKTPHVNAAIYGTELVVDVSSSATSVDVLHGAVNASNALGALDLKAGERVVARSGARLERVVIARPQDAVNWMIRFPFVITSTELIAKDDPGCARACAAAVERVVERVSQGGTLLAAVDAEARGLAGSDRGQVLRAIGLWRVGDLGAAQVALKALPQKLSPTSAALRELVQGYEALVVGDVAGARAHLDSARQSRPGMINQRMLDSYIEQASGDISRALDVVSGARVEHGDQGQLIDREAELLLSSDKARDALSLLASRLAQANNVGKASVSDMNETLAGFAALERKKFDQAAKHFERAIAADKGAGLPYLGSALLKARVGDYNSARALLSRAVQLEPANATYRSYLGKLYFDDSDTAKSLEEYEAAIAIDPNDPTPYLYRSYARVANNEPIKGLADVEQSIALNDGRAVYRSSLLVDRDLAVRSAGLARVFTELGFGEAARIEAIKSITEDYSNFSAHRLLADSYASIVDAEANLSERRIADLMAPLSFNLFNSIGESATLGDYNALFDKKETRKAVRFDYNSNRDQLGGELLASGKGDDYGYLLSYQPFYMSGSRRGAFSGANTLRGALQWEPTADDRFILDNSFTMIDSQEPNAGNSSDDIKYGYVRLGYNKRLSSSLRWLTQGEYGRDRGITGLDELRPAQLELSGLDEVINTDIFGRTSSRDRVSRVSLSSQLLYSSRYVDSVTGFEGGYVDTSRREFSPVFGIPEFSDEAVSGELTSSSGSALTSGQAYEYLSLKVPRKANLTLGVSATSVERELTQIPSYTDGTDLKTAVSPKVGLVVTPNRWLTTRAAYFESLNRKAVLEDLSSLEPTLVGGINQRFNDLSGTNSRNLGFGIDAKDASWLYGGAQYIRRHLVDSFGAVEPFAVYNDGAVESTGVVSNGFIDSHADSDILRGYLYSVISPNSVLSAETLDQWLDNTDPDFGGTTNTQRHRFGYKYFIGKHLSLGVQATYRDQSTSGLDDPKGFWLFDTGASYRFAEQRGRVFARVDNILDRDFNYDQSVGIEPQFLEGRSFVVGVTYNFW